EYVLKVDAGCEVEVDEDGEWEEKEREGEMVVAHDGDGGRLGGAIVCCMVCFLLGQWEHKTRMKG
ncbi:hypothetical protein Tco_0160392, partial [Tanacetum coccineum]